VISFLFTNIWTYGKQAKRHQRNAMQHITTLALSMPWSEIPEKTNYHMHFTSATRWAGSRSETLAFLTCWRFCNHVHYNSPAPLIISSLSYLHLPPVDADPPTVNEIELC
jgi:hypothetical protein